MVLASPSERSWSSIAIASSNHEQVAGNAQLVGLLLWPGLDWAWFISLGTIQQSLENGYSDCPFIPKFSSLTLGLRAQGGAHHYLCESSSGMQRYRRTVYL
jgi:hypothetical protein